MGLFYYRFNYTESNISWCNAVFPIGGDGTFLLAASRIPNCRKPVVGFNSDPCRSEGHLCLPKKYSTDIQSALKKLKEVMFYFDAYYIWLYNMFCYNFDRKKN